MKISIACLAAGVLFLGAPRVEATDAMQNQAKKLGFPVKNCLYCHATPHAEEVMRDRAKAFNVPAGNCLVCHGDDIPGTLNARGHWLVEQKAVRKARTCDMVWLKDYVEKPAKPETK